MTRPSTYPRGGRAFICTRCGADVWRPETDRFDDWICLNCRFGRVRRSDDTV
jgi:DNA-directed RNA polymerase subunit RPC12/RpoP